MPLLKGSSAKTRNKNIKEMMATKPKAGSARMKGIRTMMKKRGISMAKAMQIQASAAAYALQRRS